MKNQNGVSMPILIIIIVVIIAVASVAVKYVNKKIEESRAQDLRTNMLLIQAETKKGLEEVCFQIANLDKKKEEDLAKINGIKQENLKGILVQGSEVEKQMPSEITVDENYYYLDETILNDIGVENLNSEQYGYFVVKYDLDNAKVEVINTLGYEGKHTLTQLLEE